MKTEHNIKLQDEMRNLVKNGVTSEYQLCLQLGISRELCVKTGIEIGHFRKSKNYVGLEYISETGRFITEL